MLVAFCALSLFAWACVLLAPPQAHRLRERLDADPDAPSDLSAVAVLIPARDEAATIGTTLAALAAQGGDLDVIVIDDQSTDDTARVAVAVAAGCATLRLRVLAGQPLPAGWAGKLWALEQGLAAVDKPFVLLLDADIELAPRMLPTLLCAARQHDASLVSIMAELKRRHPPIWLGVSRSVRSLRVYTALGDFWSMVSRSAFTQLRYSTVLLLVTTALMLIVLLAPVAATVIAPLVGAWELATLGVLGWLGMSAAYWPVVRFYRLPAVWALTLPVAAALFLAMTWSSAMSYWRGTRASWKNRRYDRALSP